MVKHNQNGSINILLAPFVVAVLLFIVATSFAVWAFNSRQHFKNDSDQISTAAASAAVMKEDAVDAAKYNQDLKYPLTSYKGPEALGSLYILYPKTWSSYVDSTSTSTAALDGYFYPGTVPAITDTSNNFALRVQIIDQSYASVLSSIMSQQQQGQTLTISPYSAPKVPNVVGVRLEGAIQPNKSGSMVVLPLRTTTLEIWTEAQAYESDFDNNILPNFTFSP